MSNPVKQIGPSGVPSARFGWVANRLGQGPKVTFDVDIGDFEAAAVTPTVGALVPGWLLVIPRQTVHCVAEMTLDQRGKLGEVTDWARDKLASFEGDVFLFEHGAKSCGSTVGCGVDQAHLHLVSLNSNLLEQVLEGDTSIKWIEIPARDPWQSVRTDVEYYLLSDFSRAFVGYPSSTRSQYFRRVIAGSVGHADQWDYRLHPNERNAAETVRILGRPANRQFAA